MLTTTRNKARNNKRHCYFCKCRLNNSNRTIDHLIPQARGGSNSWYNKVWCCFKCNNEKGDMTEKEYRRYKTYAKTMTGAKLIEYCEARGILFDDQKRYDRNRREYIYRKYRRK